jgi:hypothetical protein
MRYLYLFLFVSWCLFLGTSRAVASEQFKSSLISDYVFKEGGESEVSQQISITNQSSEVFVQSYQFTINGPEPKNISGRDSLGPLKITTKQLENNTCFITVSFNQPIVGKGKTLTFSLYYSGPTANFNNQLWEISIPKVNASEIFDNYKVSFTIPTNFGKPVNISPDPTTFENNTFFFSNINANNTDIKASFGDYKSYHFKKIYELKNLSSKSSLQTITLTPDTQYQRFYYDSIVPTPNNVKIGDKDNWIANYQLAPHQTLLVNVSGFVHIQSNFNNLDNQYTETPYTNFPNPKVQFFWNKPNIILPFYKTTSSVEIVNSSGVAINPLHVNIASQNIFLTSDQQTLTSVLPPYSKIYIPIELSSSFVPNFSPKYLSIQVGDEHLTYNIPNNLFTFSHITYAIIFSSFIISLALFATKTWSLYLQGQKRSDNLRRKSQKFKN